MPRLLAVFILATLTEIMVGGTPAHAAYADPPRSGQRCGNNPPSTYGWEDHLPTVAGAVASDVRNINEVYRSVGEPVSINGKPSQALELIGWFYQDSVGAIWYDAKPGSDIVAGKGPGVQRLRDAAWSESIPVTALPRLPDGVHIAMCWTTLGLIPSRYADRDAR
jgi:hypothetical protein